MPLTWEIYVDLVDGDGTPDDDLSAYWVSTTIIQGMRTEDQHIADIGRCTVLLDNWDRQFSRDNVNGVYYGSLVKGRAALIKCINDYGAAISQFRGVVVDWVPQAGTANNRRLCRLELADMLYPLQDGDLSLSLMEDFQPDTVCQLIVNEAFRGGVGSASLEFIDPSSANDTIAISEGPAWAPGFSAGTTLGVQTYTLKTALTGAANEVLIETDADGSDLTPENLAAAINYDEGAGTDYGTGTTRNAGFSATARARVGESSGDADGWVALRDTTSAYDKLSTSFTVETDTITTNVVWLYLRKQGSPTGTATVKFIMNARGLPNDVQHKTVSGTFGEASVSGSGDWLRVTLSDYVTFWRHQRYHVELSTDRAAHATNYIEWGEISGTDNKSAENTGGTWTSLGAAFVWCIPGLLSVKARWRGAMFNGLTLASSNSGATWYLGEDFALPNYVTGGSDGASGLTSFTNDPDTIDIIGDQWRKSAYIDPKVALADLMSTTRGFFWCAENGTLTYKPRGWVFERIIATPVLTVTNTQNDMLIKTEQRMANRVTVTFNERRVIQSTVVAKAGGSIEIPPNVKQSAGDWETAATQGARFNPHDDVERTTVSLPFIQDDRGVITGAKNVIQPVAGTDFTLTTEADGAGRDATYLAQTRGGGMKVPTAVLGGEIECTFRSTTGITSLWVNDLQVRGDALLTMNESKVTREDSTSIAAHGLKETEINLAAMTSYGAELAESIAEYELGRGKDERTVVQSLYFSGQTLINSVQLYSVKIGDVIALTESQTGLSDVRLLVIGRQLNEHIDHKTPEITLTTRPLSDQTFWILEDATYGDLPARLSI